MSSNTTQAPADTALGLARQGFRVFPAYPAGHEKAKAPMCSGGVKDASSSPAVVRALFANRPQAAIAIATGPLGTASEGHTQVIDVDVKNGANGPENMDKLLAKLGLFSVEQLGGVIVRTPSGGYHVYLFSKDPVTNSGSGLGAALGVPASQLGIDIQGDGAYVIGPGSSGYKIEGDVRFNHKPAISPELRAILGRPRQHADKTAAPGELDVPFGGSYYDDDLSVVREAMVYAKSLPINVSEGEQTKSFDAVCKMHDLGLSPGLALDILEHLWYDRYEGPKGPHPEGWPLRDDPINSIEGKIERAYRGGAHDRCGNLTATGKTLSALEQMTGAMTPTVEAKHRAKHNPRACGVPFSYAEARSALQRHRKEQQHRVGGGAVNPKQAPFPGGGDPDSFLAGDAAPELSYAFRTELIPFGEDTDTLLGQGLRAPSRHVSYHIVDNYLVAGLLSLLHGTGGIGKSTHSQLLLYSAATGVPMLAGHFNPREREGVPVWMYNHEDSVSDIILSLLAIETHMGDLLEDTARRRLEANLTVRSGCEARPDAHLVLSQMIDGKRVPQINPRAVDTLRSTIRKKGVKVLSLDPLASLHESEENSMSEMRPLMAALTQLSTSENISVLLASHDNKEGSDFRGSSTIRDFCRIEWHLQRMDAALAETVGIDYTNVPDDIQRYSVVATNRKMTRGGEAKNMGPIALRTVAETMKVTRDDSGRLHDYPVAVMDVFDRSVLAVQEMDTHKNDLRRVIKALGGEGEHSFSVRRTCTALREEGLAPSKEPGAASDWLRKKLEAGAEVDGFVIEVTDTQRGDAGRVTKQPLVIIRKNDDPFGGEASTSNTADEDDFLAT